MKKRVIALLLMCCMIIGIVPVRAGTGLPITYNKKNYTYTQKQLKAVCNGKSVNISKTPGLLENGYGLLPYHEVFKKALKVSSTYDSTKKTITFKYNGKQVVLNVNKKTALVNGKKATVPVAPRFVKFRKTNITRLMVPSRFVAENLGLTYSYDSAKATISIKPTPTPKPTPKPEPTPDSNENTTVEENEMKAMWISYLEFGSDKKTEAQWKAKVDQMFDDCVDYGMNTVIFQVRPFGDAIYPSNYFPMSKYVAGTQGATLNYDPFAYAVQAAHERGLKIEAWFNPYRVANGSTDIKKLSKDNPARIFRETKGKERYVLSFNNNLYYNPAIEEVQQLILDGVQEVLDRYEVDGIHLDDYFYPTLGTNYKKNFDAQEYNQSASELSIADWRRENVNTLVKAMYDIVKEKDRSIRFGISPAGNPANLTSDQQYYVDIDTWLNNEGYVDYICPQIYWNFDHPSAAYDEMVEKWITLNQAQIADLYIGIAVYKAGYHVGVNDDWQGDGAILADQVEYGRETGKVQGYAFFRLDSFKNKVAEIEVQNLVNVLK